MARLTRQTLALFGSAGGSSNFGQFGSQAASAPVTTKNIATLQALAAWGAGWQSAVALGEAPYLQDMNGVMYVHSYEQCYSLQEGIAEWDAGTTYYTGSVVKYLGNAGYVELYASRIDTNLNHAPGTRITTTQWSFLYALSLGSGLIIPGTTTNDSAAAGNVGERIASNVIFSDAVTLSTTVYANITSISLTAGDWDVVGQCALLPNGASSISLFAGNISLFSGNTLTDLVTGDNWLSVSPGSFSGSNDISATIAGYQILLASPATVYLKASATFGGGTAKAYGRISARRMR